MGVQSPPSQVLSGRLHRRMYLTVPVRLLDPETSLIVEDTVTENVSPHGVRVTLKTVLQRDTVLQLRSVAPKVRSAVRVVYCESLSGGRFAVGLQFRETTVNWTERSVDAAA